MLAYEAFAQYVKCTYLLPPNVSVNTSGAECLKVISKSGIQRRQCAWMNTRLQFRQQLAIETGWAADQKNLGHRVGIYNDNVVMCLPKKYRVSRSNSLFRDTPFLGHMSFPFCPFTCWTGTVADLIFWPQKRFFWVGFTMWSGFQAEKLNDNAQTRLSLKTMLDLYLALTLTR